MPPTNLSPTTPPGTRRGGPLVGGALKGGKDVTLQATKCLRGQLKSISSARQELWLQNLESNEPPPKGPFRACGGAGRDSTDSEYFALRQHAWQEDVDALRLRAGECFADPAWAVVNEYLRQHRDEEVYELATIDI